MKGAALLISVRFEGNGDVATIEPKVIAKHPSIQLLLARA
jgi:hypothetical protein